MIAEQLLAGPVDLGAGFALYLLLVLIVIPGLTIAGGVLLLIALVRHLGRNKETATYDAKAARRTRRFTIAGVLMCLPLAILIANQLWSYRQGVESRERYLAKLEFDIYEPANVPPGYQLDPEMNTYRDPPYIDYYMAEGVHVTQFEYTPQVAPFLDDSGPCDPAAALSYLIQGGATPEPISGVVAVPCRPLISTPEGRVLNGTGERSPSSGSEDMFIVLDKTVVLFEFSFMYQGDKSEIPALVDSLRPIAPESLKDR